MRNFHATLWVGLLFLGATTTAAWADADPPRGECHRLTRQIVRYEGDLVRAKERDNELWARANEAQLERLGARLRRRCPDHVPAPTFGDRVGAALDLAGRGAMKVLPFLY